MNLFVVADHLTAEGLGVPGKTLFVHHMPSKITQGLLVTQQSMDKRNPYATAYVHAAFEITARDVSIENVEATMNSVSDAMTSNGLELDGHYFHYIRPVNTPLVYPVSESDLMEASVLFDTRFTRN